MSAPLGGLLKHIPCPNGDACTTYRCLFRHAKDEIGLATSSSADQQKTTENDASKSLTPNAPATICTVRDEASPRQQASLQGRAEPDHHKLDSRKRILATDSPSEKADDAATVPKREAEPDPGHQGATHKTPSASSSRPLKRPRIGQTHDSTAIPKASAIQAAGTAPPPQPRAEAKKPERSRTVGLNPRYLRSAPAKHEIRLRLLVLLHKQFKRLNDELRASGSADEKATLLLSEQDLIVLALDVEESFAVSKSSAVYADAIKHRVMGYMHMKLDQWKKERTEHYILQQEEEKQKRDSAVALPEPANPDQTERARDRPAATRPAATRPAVTAPPAPKQPDNDIPPAQEIEILKRHFLTPIDRLAAYGYVPTVPTAAEIQAARAAEAVSGGWEVCAECATRFQVFPGRREEDGALASRGPCVHHLSRYDRRRDAYACCGERPGAAGCAKNENHHFKVNDAKRLAALWNFVETPANPNVPADRAVCFDCEMGYTVYGMEVVRLTATDWRSGRVLLDVLVRPLGEIIDLNSQYSGVWPKDMADAQPYSAGVDSSADASATEEGPDKGGDTTRSTTDAQADAAGGDGKERPPLQIVPSPQAARELFFTLISPETPLIGHGLENDLNVMRIVHPTLVDTVLLFPHPRLLPYRHSLKSLMMNHLGRYIQQKTTSGGEVQGHDSAEDARAAGDLVRYKIKQKWAAIRSG